MSKKTRKVPKTAKPSQVHYSKTALGGVSVVAVLAVLGSLGFYQVAIGYAHANPDVYRVGFQQERLQELKSDLAPCSMVGYISDLPPGSVEDNAAFSGARYALAPCLVVRGASEPKLEWVLGNFSRPVDPAPYAAANHLRVAKLYGPAVVLFRRESR